MKPRDVVSERFAPITTAPLKLASVSVDEVMLPAGEVGPRQVGIGQRRRSPDPPVRSAAVRLALVSVEEEGSVVE